MALPDSPLTRGEQYLAKAAGQDTALPDVPLTRVEQYMAKIAGQDVAIPNVPLTRLEQYLAAIAEGGGGSSVTVEPLTVTSNGTQTAPSGKAYSPVTVNVPQPSGTKSITISQNGTTTESVTNYASASIAVDVEPGIVYNSMNGGTATLANPFDGLDYGNLMDGLAPSTAKWNAFISFQFQGMDVLFHPYVVNDAIMAMAFLPDDGQGNPIGAYAQWNENGGLDSLYLLSSGQLQDISSMAVNIPCTTIIYGTTAPPSAT